VRELVRARPPEPVDCRPVARLETRTRTVTPSGLSWSPASWSPAVSECRKNPRRRTRGSATSISTPPLKLSL